MVPSRDSILSLFTNRGDGCLYVLMRIGANAGQMAWQLMMVVSQFSWLKAFEVSTKIMAPVSSSSKIAFMAWTCGL